MSCSLAIIAIVRVTGLIKFPSNCRMETTSAARTDQVIREQFLYQTHLSSGTKAAKEKKG